MLRSASIALLVLSVVSGCAMLKPQEPDVIITSRHDLTVVTLEPYKGKYDIVTKDSTVRKSGTLPAGMIGIWPTNEEMQNIGISALPSREK